MTSPRSMVFVLLLFGAVSVAASVIAARAAKGRPGPAETEVRTSPVGEEEEERARRPRREQRGGAKQEAKAIEFLKQFRPDVVARLAKMKSEEPERYREVIHDASREAMELEAVKTREPQEYAERVRWLEFRARPHRLAAQYFTAPESRRESIRGQLISCLGEVFDQRQRELEAELRELEERIEAVREEVRLHRAGKARLLREYLEELMGDGQVGAVQW